MDKDTYGAFAILYRIGMLRGNCPDLPQRQNQSPVHLSIGQEAISVRLAKLCGQTM
jgi:hypothetical protein